MVCQDRRSALFSSLSVSLSFRCFSRSDSTAQFRIHTELRWHPSNDTGPNIRHARCPELCPRLVFLCLAHVQAVDADQVELTNGMSAATIAGHALPFTTTRDYTQGIVARSHPSNEQKACAQPPTLSTHCPSPPCPCSGSRKLTKRNDLYV